MEKATEDRRFRRVLLQWGIPLLICLALYLIPPLFVTPVYRLNDDLQIRDILSGAASGRPDMHTVYMRAPLSAILAGLYRLAPGVAWFGLFQCACIALCSFIILRRFMERPGISGLSYAGGIVFFTFLYISCLRQFYLMPHYTLTAAVCGATALVCMLLPKRLRLRDAVCSGILLLLCDQIRSQVFLLVLPHALLAFAYLIYTGKLKPKAALYALGGFGIGFGILFLLHTAAYAGPQWQAYLAVNRARTQLYDYTGVWESDEAKAYYAQHGIDDAAYPLLKNYALLPLTDLDAGDLSALAAWKEPGRALSGMAHAKAALWDLRQHVFHVSELSDAPYNIYFFLCYLLAFIHCLKPSRRRALPLLILSFLLHFVLYGYLLWNGRAPERVILSLYIAQLTIPLSLLLGNTEDSGSRVGIGNRERLSERDQYRKALWTATDEAPKPADRVDSGSRVDIGNRERLSERDQYRKATREEHRSGFGAGVLLLVMACIMQGDESRLAIQNTVNARQDVVYSYMAEHAGELFLLDSYACVYRTEPVFTAQGSTNALLLGGWLYGSPLVEDKLKRFGYGSREELIERGGAYVVCRLGAGLAMEELMAYMYNRQPQGAQLTAADMLYAGEDIFLIYYLDERDDRR